MKKFLLMILPLLAFSSCEYDDTDLKNRLDDLDDKVTEIAARVDALNSDVNALEQLISGKRFISDVTQNEDGSYTLTLITSTGESSTITIRNGHDGTSPAIGVKQDTDGKYYWSLNGEFILAGGKKLPVSGENGATPEFKIEKGMWYVSYDKGATWAECGKATGDDGSGIFKSVALSEDGKTVFITLNDGKDTVLTFALYTQFGIAFDTTSGTLRVGETLSVPFTLTGADDKTLIETLPSDGWQAEVKLAEGGGTIDVTAPADSSTGKVIVLVSDGGDKTLMRTLTFVAGVLNVSTSSREATAAGGPVTVEVDTDLEYEVVIPEDAKDWITLSETRGEIRHETLTFNISASTLPEPREAIVELVSGNTAIETILIYQMPYFDPAAFVVRVAAKESLSKLVVLPLYGAVDVTIDWGDGQTEQVAETIATKAAMKSHIYAQAGTYYITVKGSVEKLNANLTTRANQSDIQQVVQWGKTSLQSLLKAFLNNTAITSVPSPEEGAFAAVTTVESMFSGCTALRSVPADLFAQMTALTNVSSLFDDCAALENIPQELFANNVEVTDAGSLFSGCKALTEIPENLFTGMPAITDLSSVFAECTKLETVPGNLFERQTRATTLSSLFSKCTALRSVPAELFLNQTETTSIYSMFKGCTSLESLPDDLLAPFAHVTNMGSLFSGCSALGNLPTGLFEHMSAVTTANYLFEGCTGMSVFPSLKSCTALKSVNAMWKDCSTLVSAPADYFPDCEPIRTSAMSIAYMFQNCQALKNVPENLFANFTGTTIISQMFQNCTSLESLPAGIFDGMPNITTADKTFYGCTAFTGESPYTIVGDEKVHLYERDPRNGFVKITDAKAKNCFTGCEKIADRTLIPIAWGGLNDGTKAKPTFTLSMNTVEGAEYYSMTVNIKGTELKSGRMGLFTKERLNQFLEEMDGSLEKVCNRNCVGLTTAWVNSINSAAGLSDTSTTLEAGTDYVLLVSGTNVHGTTVATVEARTADFPAGDANYERYIGTWTVTSASSEKSQQPLTFTVEVKPYRINESYKVSSWGITTWGDDYPFVMNYETDGTVSIPTSDYQGMAGGYYVYLKYRFFNPATSTYLIWSSNGILASGSYENGKVTVEGKKFTDPNSSKEYTVSGMDYCLYKDNVWYEHAKYFKPGFTVSDYTVGPYTMTKTSPDVSKTPARDVHTNVLLPASETKQGSIHAGLQEIKAAGK